jgi:hypothetical protein
MSFQTRINVASVGRRKGCASSLRRDWISLTPLFSSIDHLVSRLRPTRSQTLLHKTAITRRQVEDHGQKQENNRCGGCTERGVVHCNGGAAAFLDVGEG